VLVDKLETEKPETMTAPLDPSPPQRLEDALAAHTPSFLRRLLPWTVLLSFVAGGVAAVAAFATIERPIAVDVIEVGPGEVERTVASVAAGRVAARHRAKIAASVMARVTRVLAKKGEPVERDQVVVELDGAEAAASLEMARCSADAIASSISETDMRLAQARNELARRKKLGPAVVSPELLERAAMETSAFEAQVATLRAHAAEAEAHVKTSQTLLDKHLIRAPFAGVISDMWVEVGEVTTTVPGMTSMKSSGSDGSKLFEVIDPDDLYITAPIDEVDLARVKVGQNARVALDPYPKEPFLGVVTRIAPYVLDVEEQNRTVEIEISIPAAWKDRALKPGTSADVEVIVEKKEGVPRLPAHLLIDGKRTLTIEQTAGDGGLRVVEREVEVGIESWRYAEVKGLAVGTRVVTGAAGDVRVKPGQLVTIRSSVASEGADR
jgi:HlyD family secretion protein